MNDLQPSKKLLPGHGQYDSPDSLLQQAQDSLADSEMTEAIACSVLAIAMILNRRFNGFWIDPSITPDE